jgi:hypothetical protein
MVRFGLAFAGFWTRSKVHFTSSAEKGWPLWNFTPLLRWKM